MNASRERICGGTKPGNIMAAMNNDFQSAELWTEEKAASFLAVKPRTVRLWRQTRGLPHIRITSKVIRYRKSDIDDWLERRRVAIVAEPRRRRFLSRA
ncbi:MAG: helix-turn-helix domain-containing protein [Verrucomicrobiota bacterium]